MIRPDDWQPTDGLKLEPNAMIAAREGISCQALTAGPGAGKTEMLAQRADFLLRTATCRFPKRILAISFKVDAARNLKERVQRRCGRTLSARLDSHTFHAFAKRIIDRFRPILAGSDALDVDYTIGDQRILRKQIQFNDLVPLAIQILENCDVARNAIRQTYSDVFLDEFQDCTNLQYKLIKLAFHGTAIRLTAVGDTKQKLMGWAGALEGIFVVFAHDFNAVPLNLYLNFRSQPSLLRMQNEIIRVLDPRSVMPDELIDGNGELIEIWSFDNSLEEAECTASQIDHWIKEEGLLQSEIAVLISKQADLYAEHLMASLERRGIPFRNEQQLQDLATEPVTLLVVDFLLVICGDREPNAYNRLMSQLTDSGSDELNSSNSRNDWLSFISSEREKMRKSIKSSSDFDVSWGCVISLFKKLGRDTLMSLSADYESWTRFKQVVSEIKSCLKEMMDAEKDLATALSLFADQGAVRIMTIHKSKGLEFDSVIILGVEAETFWGKAVDERCAFFVGVSRAKRRLVLTVADHRQRPSGFSGRWSASRKRHEEFLRYAEPFCESR
jgi:superfamily I DNA/RNA helicase